MRPTIAFFTDPEQTAAYPRIRYVLDALERHPYAPPQLQCLLQPESTPPGSRMCYYGSHKNASAFQVFIPAQSCFLFAKPAVRQTVNINTFDWEKSVVYGVSTSSPAAGQPFFRSSGRGGAFGFDWMETLFFHWSRLEEYAATPEEEDEIGLMKSSAQLLPRHGLHHRPVADQLVAAVLTALGFPPALRPTTFTLSHDLDDLQVFGAQFRLLRYLGGVALRHRSLRAWPRIVSDYRRQRQGHMPDPGDTFDWLLRLGPQVEKTLYFGFGNHSRYDHFPDLKTPRLLEVRDMARELGYQFGIHPSFNTWKDAALLQQECRLAESWLGQPVRRSRQHYLHFAFPETADALEEAGIAEDATLGFRDRIGFRAGTGFPYHLYCFASERAYRWIEKPLIAMDCGLLREAGGKAEPLRQFWEGFLTQNKNATAISLNLHNTFPYEQALHGMDFRILFGAALSPHNPML